MVCTVYFWDKKVIIAREPWSGGYGKRLTYRRLWVWIQVPYTGWTFFSYICCKICNVCLKRPKISKKRRVSALFKKNKVIICLNCWGGKQTQNSFYIFLGYFLSLFFGISFWSRFKQENQIKVYLAVLKSIRVTWFWNEMNSMFYTLRYLDNDYINGTLPRKFTLHLRTLSDGL